LISSKGIQIEFLELGRISFTISGTNVTNYLVTLNAKVNSGQDKLIGGSAKVIFGKISSRVFLNQVGQ
jgi:hypothetical protein